MNKYLLDTSTISSLMEDSPKVKDRLGSLAETDYLLTSPIVKGEILFGIFRLPSGTRRQILEQKANQVFSVVPCHPMPEDVSEDYARTKIAAQQRGTPLDECDLWIAATAMAVDAILVTSDNDFQRITGLGLQVEDWTD